MSKEHTDFINETGEVGFLAGIVDVISDNLEIILDFGYSLDADIFYIKNNDISLLNNTIKKRLKYYNKNLGNTVSEEKINALDFQLEELKTDVHKFICNQMKQYSSSNKLSNEINKFLAVLNWHLQKPLCIYLPSKMPDKNIHTLGKIYIYDAWNYFFISYYDTIRTGYQVFPGFYNFIRDVCKNIMKVF